MLSNFLKFLALVAAVAAAYLFRGYVIMMSWQWLVVPLFKQPPITLLQSITLSFFLAVLMFHNEENTDSRSKSKRLAEGLLDHVVLLFYAYILSLFV